VGALLDGIPLICDPKTAFVVVVSFYRHFIRPLFFSADPERVHHFAIGCLEIAGPMLRFLAPRLDARLGRKVFGVHFPSPVGLAAGFDKNAVALAGWEALGFGFAEVGTITAKAQPGNPRPRLFRIPEMEAVINRLGFNNEGAESIAHRLETLRRDGSWPSIPVGVNLGKSKVTPLGEATADYVTSFRRLRGLGDYFVLNVSSPNTPGLRQLQDKAALEELLGAVQAENNGSVPLLLKIAPDLEWSAIEEILALVELHKLAGLIVTNTTIDHSSVPESRRQQGGLSGRPLRERSFEVLKFVVRQTRLPVIAVGGIGSADEALRRLDAGAALIQIYTALVYEGPALIHAIHNALLSRIAR
jgi:dihydroorotate dehydrogenase